ncbi:MAG TPA: hypothetical protein VIH42_06770 [Thermoguttaceae bacterium]
MRTIPNWLKVALVIVWSLVAVMIVLAFDGRAYNINTNTGHTPAAQVKQESEQRYWITIKSGVRHNSSCRYYRNSKGRLCGPNEGRACKICGR